MAVLSNTGIRAGASAAGAGGYQIEKSLRFNPDDTPELTRTPSSGDSKKFTISFWLKLCSPDATQMIIQTDDTYADLFRLYFSSGKFRVHQYNVSTYFWQYISTPVFRDTAAWYHVVFSYDADNSTEADRARTWINGVQITDWDTVDHPNSGDDAGWNQTSTTQRIGREWTSTYGNAYNTNGYLAEFHSIDGQSLDESSFGETNEDTGQWVAKEYEGTYGDNGFYLKFNGTDIGEDSSGNDNDFTATNLTASQLTTVSTATGGLPFYNTSGDQGGTKESGYRADSSAGTTDGTGLVFAMPGDVLTDEHDEVNTGSSANTMSDMSTAPTASTDQSKYYGTSLKFTGNGGTKTGSSADFAFGTGDYTIECWFYNTGSAGYLWDFRSSGATGATYMYWASGTQLVGLNVSSLTVTQNAWHHIAVVRSSGVCKSYIDGVEKTSTAQTTDFSNSTVISLGARYTDETFQTAYMQDFRVYKGVAKYTSAFSVIQPESLEADVSTDSPTNFDDGGNGTGNYCTWNPLKADNSLVTYSQGNLKLAATGSTGDSAKMYGWGTIACPTGKWYWEDTGLSNRLTGISADPLATGTYSFVSHNTISNSVGGSATGAATAITTSDVIGVALDTENWTLTYYKNGTEFYKLTGINQLEYHPWSGVDSSGTASANHTNFGQRAFAYTPPTDYKALNTYNLPDPVITDPSKYFETKTYSGTGSTLSITGLNFKPDLVWIKNRSTAYSHCWYDAVRGVGKRLASEGTYAEDTYNLLTAFTDDGFTLGSGFVQNASGETHVSWNWDAGTANTVDSDIDAGDTWSDDAAVSSGGFATGFEATKAFDGLLTTRAATTNSSETITWTPDGGKSYSSKVEMYNASTAMNATINGGSTIAVAADTWVTLATGSGSITAITSVAQATASGSISAIRVDDKILVDPALAPSVSVGGLNSTIYDQSDTWSSDGSNAVAGNPWTNGFDGDDSNTVYADHNQTATWTPDGTITGITSLEVKGYAYQAGGTYSKFKINGTDYTSTFGSDYTVWKTITGITTLTSISVGQEDGTHATGFVAVRINGKELIDTGVSVTDFPTIASTYRANPDAGFSIVSYTGNGVTGATVAHGLGAKPDLVILKSRNYQYNWTVYHKSLGNTHGIYLNLTNAKEDNATFWDDTDPTSTVITFGNDGNTNVNGSDIVAYCWSEVAGYSKFGSYSGNSVDDGVFIYCGFKPAFVMIKNSSYTTEWVIVDNARDTDNVVQHILNPDDTTSDDTSTNLLDFTSNGFKLRSATSRANESANTMIYAAFAETPLKYSNAR